MSYTKIEEALKSVLPDAVYKVQAPEIDACGNPLRRYLVWTPTGERYIYSESMPFAKVYQVVVTVASQIEDDQIASEVVQALSDAHVSMQQTEHSYDADTATYYTDIQCEVV